jgi:16S rRNA (cytosine1402-N4)-methyltransferase
MEFSHKPVLLEECIEGLNIIPDGIYVDGTLGGGGHSEEILKRLDSRGILLGIDQDENAINAAEERLIKKDDFVSQAKMIFAKANFNDIKKVCIDNGIEEVDGVLLDLGVSSYQLDEAQRGFSYMQDAPLDMRMDQQSALTASDIVNEYSENDMRDIISKNGEEKWAARIAKFIVEERNRHEISTTFQLVNIIKAAIPKGARQEGGHPAKRTFQALRIEVNGELRILGEAIKDAVDLLKPGKRICVISFHSLEDRIVKNTFNEMLGRCTCPKDLPICMCNAKQVIKLINRKPIVATDEELFENLRAKSAKLRIAEKIGNKFS